MFFNIFLITELASPSGLWAILILALIFGILSFVVAIYSLILHGSRKYGFIITGIVSLALITLWFFGLFETIERQKTYDEWYKNYYEEIVYDKIYSFNSSSPTFVIGYTHYSKSNCVKYLFYIEKEDEPGTYKLAYIPEGRSVYVKEVESDFNVVAIKKENSKIFEYYINVPKGSFTEPVASTEDNLVAQ